MEILGIDIDVYNDMLCITDLANHIRDNYNPTLNVSSVINTDAVVERIAAAYGIEFDTEQSVVAQLKERGLYMLKGYAKERKAYAAPLVFAIVAMQLHASMLLPILHLSSQILKSAPCYERLG